MRTCGDGATINGGVTRTGAPTYRCSAAKHLDRLAAPVDEFVTEVLLTYLSRERVDSGTPGDVAGETSALAQEAAGLRARLDALADDLEIDEHTLARRSRALRARLQELESQMASVSSAAA
jgi:site-specific DNA recombinase